MCVGSRRTAAMTNMLAGTIVMQSIRLPTHVNRERDGGAAISSCGQVIVGVRGRV